MAAPVAQPVARTARLISLDVFRGVTMGGMVIVNNPGDWNAVYWPLEHAGWNGWTPTDLIFPFFLFIVGVAITLSRKSASWSSMFRRAAIIFGLGLFVAGFPHFDVTHWRIPGVLQRIAVCYLFAAGTYRLTKGDRRRQGWIMLGLGSVLTVLYYVLMTQVTPPGGVAGDLSAEGNVGAYLDRALMLGHLWRPMWDPEGVLSTVPAIATTMFGIIAGLWITSSTEPRRKVSGLLAAGVIGIAIGYAWHPFFPINKNLWTSSYVFFTAGAAAICLGVCYWLIDVRGSRAWATPFVVLGSNAITLFVASAILVKTIIWIKVPAEDGAHVTLMHWIYSSGFEPFMAPKHASLGFAIANLAVLFLLLLWMYRRRIFLKV